MRCSLLLVASATWLTLGCSDGNTGPAPSGDGQRLAAQFERLADSVDAGGYSPAADALRHAAEIVRLTGHATPVSLTIDGSARGFLAVAEQIDFPNLVCRWPSDSGITPPPDTLPPPPPDTLPGPPTDTLPAPPPDTVPAPPVDTSGTVPPDTGVGGGAPGDSVPPPEPPAPPECTVAGTYSMRTLIAWEPEHMAEVVRIVADVGTNGVEPGVPDVMTNLPTTAATDPQGTTAPPDSAPGGGGGSGGYTGYPGFMGEYLVRDQESWWAVEGTQANALEEVSGACTEEKATLDWAEFTCEAAQLRFEFSMRVEPLGYERLTSRVDPPDGAEGSHTLAMRSNQIDGVRLTWEAWVPPPRYTASLPGAPRSQSVVRPAPRPAL
jgi:hypothetical protein